MPLAPEGQISTVKIGDFRTEAGGIIYDSYLAYQRWGQLRVDADGRTNVILVEHALTGNSNAVEWWPGIIGPGLALDTDIFCVICTDVLGGCDGSIGPSSPHPDGGWWGSRFPAIDIRDMVRAEHKLLTHLGISRLASVIGGSMGGARALEWGFLFPEMCDSSLILAVSARASAWQIGIQSSQIQSIVRDPHWLGGDYYGRGVSPEEGLGAARKLAHLTYRGELELDERFGTDPQRGENPMGEFRDSQQRFTVQSYLDYQAKKLVHRFDAGTYVTLTEALNRHDVGRGRGGLIKALARHHVPTVVAGVNTDILYPYHQQEHLARNLGNLLTLQKISSPVGHDAFLIENRQVTNIIQRLKAQSGIDHTIPEGTPSQ